MFTNRAAADYIASTFTSMPYEFAEAIGAFSALGLGKEVNAWGTAMAELDMLVKERDAISAPESNWLGAAETDEQGTAHYAVKTQLGRAAALWAPMAAVVVAAQASA